VTEDEGEGGRGSARQLEVKMGVVCKECVEQPRAAATASAWQTSMLVLRQCTSGTPLRPVHGDGQSQFSPQSI
jgi:hypothetical protein